MKDDIYYAHMVMKGKKGKEATRHAAGRFMVKGGHVHHLEDYHGLLDKSVPEGFVDDYMEGRIQRPGAGLSIASHSDIAQGNRLDFIKDHPLDKEMNHDVTHGIVNARKPSVFHYHRAGFDTPHLVEAKNGKFTLDGNVLDDHEVKTILDNVKSGAGKLKYPPGQSQSMMKAEHSFRSLNKSEDEELDPQAALAHLDSLAGSSDPKTQAAIASVRKHIFQDPMTGLGNKYAYNEFLKKNPEGVHVMVDGNGMKTINDTYGHEAGDQLIRSYGHAMRQAAEEIGPKQVKLHRFGGDELHAFLPTAEHAHHFARTLRDKLDAMPPINGTHKVSASIGVGHTPEHADKSLYKAKAMKIRHLTAGGAAHDTPSFIHSSISDAPAVSAPAVPVKNVG